MDLDPDIICGVACLVFDKEHLVLEVQKQHKWEQVADQPPLIGLGCIGGTVEQGESPLETLHREAIEEMQCGIDVKPAPFTVDISPDGVALVQDVLVDDVRPALVWETVHPAYEVGKKVVAFLGRVNGVPEPNDLPALAFVKPHGLIQVRRDALTICEAQESGFQFLSRVTLPLDGRLKLTHTLSFLYDFQVSHPKEFSELLIN